MAQPICSYTDSLSVAATFRYTTAFMSGFFRMLSTTSTDAKLDLAEPRPPFSQYSACPPR